MKTGGWILAALAAMVAVGCATPSPRVAPLPRPVVISTDWVARGSGAFEIAGERIFCGVGRSSGASNAILLRTAADNRAKDELAEVLNAYMVYLADTYLAGNQKAGEMEGPKGEMLKAAAAAVAESGRARAVIVEHRQVNGAVASLCQLELSVFKVLVAEDARLGQGFRQFCQDRADTLHASFSKAGRFSKKN